MKYQLCKKRFDVSKSEAPTIELPDNAVPLAKEFYSGILYLEYLVPSAASDASERPSALWDSAQEARSAAL